MTEQLVIHRHDYDAGNQGLSWARIIGIAFVIALHLTALMMLLIPAVAPKAPAEKERTTMVTLVDAPPPPPAAAAAAAGRQAATAGQESVAAEAVTGSAAAGSSGGRCSRTASERYRHAAEPASSAGSTE